MTLKQHMNLKRKIGGYKKILNEEIETEFADHIKNLAAMFQSECHEMAFELANKYEIGYLFRDYSLNVLCKSQFKLK